MKWFEVYDPKESSPEFAHELEADNAGEAAEIVCHDLDGGSERFRDNRTVLVRERGSDRWERVYVEAEAVVQYTAYPDEDED